MQTNVKILTVESVTCHYSMTDDSWGVLNLAPSYSDNFKTDKDATNLHLP